MQPGVLRSFAGAPYSRCARLTSGRMLRGRLAAASCSLGRGRVMHGMHTEPGLHCSARQMQGWSAEFRTRLQPRPAQCYSQQHWAAVGAAAPSTGTPAARLHSRPLVGQPRMRVPQHLVEQRRILCYRPVAASPAAGFGHQ